MIVFQILPTADVRVLRKYSATMILKVFSPSNLFHLYMRLKQ